MGVRSSQTALRRVSDEDLWALVARGDPIAFGELYERFAELLRIAARSWLEDDAAAEDLTAETLARAWERRAQWRPRRVKTALVTAALNLARDVRASESARDDRQRAWCAETLSPLPSADRPQELRSLRAELRAAIAALPLRRRRAFVLACIHGHSHDDIAERMGIEPRTVERHLALAKAELRAKLSLLRED